MEINLVRLLQVTDSRVEWKTLHNVARHWSKDDWR